MEESTNTKWNLQDVTSSRTFFDTQVGEEAVIIQDYVDRGESVVGWEWSLIGTLSVFVLYLG